MMRTLANLMCRSSGHAAPLRPIWNEGWEAGCCRRCDTQVCRRLGGRSWAPPPRGLRLVWKPITPEQQAFRRALAAIVLREECQPAGEGSAPPRRHKPRDG